MPWSRSSLPRVLPLFSGVFLSASLFAQTDFDQVQITETKVAGSVHMLMGQGGNIAVSIGEDGVLMVDDQFAPLAGKLRAAIRELGGGAPTYVVNTHYHGDHTGGNEAFADGAIIIGHENLRQRLAAPDSGRVPEALPLITYTDSLSLHLNGEEVRLIHPPGGHTDGDTVVWFTGSKVMHMGDLFFAIRFPFVDLAGGGSVERLLRNLDMLLELMPEDIQVIPGHGSLSTKAEFARYLGGLKNTATFVTEKIEAGMNLEAIVAEGLPEQYQGWGQGFVSEPAWITTIYNSYANIDIN